MIAGEQLAGEQLGVDRPPSSRTTTALSVVVAGLLILGIVGVVTHDPTPATIHVSVGAAGDRLREATSYRLRTSISEGRSGSATSSTAIRDTAHPHR